MRTFTVIALLAFEVQAHAEDQANMDMLVNKFAEKLLDRTFQANDSTNLDDSVLGKPAVASRSALPSVGGLASQLRVPPSLQDRSTQHVMPVILNPYDKGSLLVCEATYQRKKGTMPRQPLQIKNTPYHKRGRFVTSPLSKELRAQWGGVRNMVVRIGDEVKVAAGQYAPYEGKVTRVNRKYGFIDIEGLNKDRTVRDQMTGEKNVKNMPIGMLPSKCVITRMALDKDREFILARKQAGGQIDKKEWMKARESKSAAAAPAR